MDDLFYGTSGPRSARIAIVGEAWGYDESVAQKPFVGQSGQELNRMLAEAGIDREKCFATNLIAERPPANDLFKFFYSNPEAKTAKLVAHRGLFPHDRILKGEARLIAQLSVVKPDLIILCGNYPLWALTDAADITSLNPKERNPERLTYKVPGGIGKQRGSMLWTREDTGLNIPCLPVYHPAGILRNWPWRAVTVHDFKLRVPLALNGKWEKPQWTRILGLQLNTVIPFLTSVLKQIQSEPVLSSIDLETRNRCIASLAITVDGQTALAIPFMRPTETGMSNWWSLDEELQIVKILREIISHPNCLRIGQNFAYDSQYMSHWWRIDPDVYFDTMLGQHLLFPGTPKALYYLASIYSDYYAFWKEDSQEWESALDIDRLLLYNCDDVIYTWQIAQRLREAIVLSGKLPHYEFLLEEWHLSMEMMERGIPIDNKIRSDMTFKVAEAAAARQEWLNNVVPEYVRPPVGRTAKAWYSSPKQQQSLFYEMLGCKSIHHRKTGNVTINDEALNELKLRYPELSRILDTLIELRSLGVFQNNFLSAAIDPDGRMRSSFNVAGTETFRWSSSENAFRRGTNLQNIPKGDE